MKKSLLFFAAYLTCIPYTWADSFNKSSLLVYGLVDLSVIKDSIESASGKSTLREGSGATPSRIGFQGSENLGGGYSAIFQLEAQFQPEYGALADSSKIWGRQAYIGFKGQQGTIKFGRTKSIFEESWNRIDPFSTDGLVGGSNKKILQGGVISTRLDNAITYFSPKISGFAIAAQFSKSTQSQIDDGYEVIATFDQGPFGAQLGYAQAKQLTNGEHPKITMIGVTYTLGTVKFGALYNKGKLDPISPPSIQSNETKNWLMGVNWKVGNGDVKLSFADSKNSSSELYREFGLGYIHHLSKQVDCYIYGSNLRDAVSDKSQTKTINSFALGVTYRF